MNDFSRIQETFEVVWRKEFHFEGRVIGYRELGRVRSQIFFSPRFMWPHNITLEAMEQQIPFLSSLP